MKRSDIFLNKKTMGLDYIFTFGKHKDEPIKDVIEIDPSYIIWCSENIDWFDLDTDVYDLAHTSRMDQAGYEAEQRARREFGWLPDGPDEGDRFSIY